MGKRHEREGGRASTDLLADLYPRLRNPSLQVLKKGYAEGDIRKEDFAAALRAHQAALDETKSPQREMAHAARKY